MSNRVKISFSLQDDMGNKYVFKSNEKFDPDYDEVDVFYLIRAFKKFLINAGYTKSTADRITYEGISEEDKEDIEL